MKRHRREAEKKRERAERRRSRSPQLLLLVTFLQNAIAARFGAGTTEAALREHKRGGAARLEAKRGHQRAACVPGKPPVAGGTERARARAGEPGASADGSPTRAGANGTTERHPKDELRAARVPSVESVSSTVLSTRTLEKWDLISASWIQRGPRDPRFLPKFCSVYCDSRCWTPCRLLFQIVFPN